jgi:transcriptional regulator with XRE-family HTH domain
MSQPDPQMALLGDYLRAQRQMANLSLRQLSALTEVSNPYLSQIERGLHEPSVRVLKALAEALNISAESLLIQAGLLEERDATARSETDTETAIASDERLTAPQREALLSVYRSYIGINEKPPG